MKKKKLNFDPDLLKSYMLGGLSDGDKFDMDSAKDKIDLHLDRDALRHTAMTSGEMLAHQLGQVHKQIDSAIAQGLSRIEIIHGKGSGKLRKEVHVILTQHPEVLRYELSWDNGKTVVYF